MNECLGQPVVDKILAQVPLRLFSGPQEVTQQLGPYFDHQVIGEDLQSQVD